MKKIYLLLVTFMSLTQINAQWIYSTAVSSNISGTYTDLGTNGTAITNNFAGGAMTYDDANSAVQNIGFNFVYNGTTFTQFVLNSNGFIKLGSTAPAAANIFYTTFNLSTTGSTIQSTETNLIYPLNHDLQGAVSPEYRVYTSGVAPNRTCIIQFKNLKDKIGTAAQLQFSNIQFQIKLTETTNAIDFIYGTWTSNGNTPAFKTFAVGIKGSTIANSINVTKSSAGTWNTATFLAGNYTGNSHNIRNEFMPDAGRTYHFETAKPNDLSVNQIYALGKIPVPAGTPHTISAVITNIGLNAKTNVNVALNIAGANAFSNVQTIANIASGASATVTFANFTPTVTGDNNITVSLPADDVTTNDSKTIVQKANTNTWSYMQGNTFNGSLGLATASVAFASKFTSSAFATLSQVGLNFASTGQQYTVGIFDAGGTPAGAPGSSLWTSGVLTTTPGPSVVPIDPPLTIPSGDFTVVVTQLSATNRLEISYQNESPVRAGTYFLSTDGGTVWSDVAPTNNFRPMMEPKLQTAQDAALSTITAPSNITCLGNNESVSVVLRNSGSSNIAVGAATLTLKVRGANTNTLTKLNTLLLANGETETITFTGVNFSNAGTNFDTVFVTYAGDLEKDNDTLKTSNRTATTLTALPATEDFETTFPVFSWVNQIAGLPDVGWSLITGKFKNADMTDSLAPHGGNKYLLFDSWNAADGVVNRLYSNCITLPQAAQQGPCGGTLTFFMSHDTSVSSSLDSMYISISTDKGVTWNRIPGAGFARYNAAFITPGWKSEIVDISAYAGQTFQLGFEAVSKFGNIMGLDDIVITSTCPIPVNLISFTAKRTGKVNNLNWSTSQELNTKHTIIERSNNGNDFIAIGKVNNAGNTATLHNYTFTDNNPVKGINYYRLRMIDLDNTAKLSAVRSVRNDGTADISIYPNPVKDKLNIAINADNADIAQITINDINGRIIYTANKVITQGENLIPVALNNTASGTYLIKIKLSNDLIIRKFNK